MVGCGVGTEVAAQLVTPPGTTPTGCAPRPPSPSSAAPRRYRPAAPPRHRLNRSGRHENYALHIIALVRLSPPTQAYAARQRAEGLSSLEIPRCFQRYVAREIHHVLAA
jgi:hypothetical protein